MSLVEIPVPYLFVSSCSESPEEWVHELDTSGISTNSEAMEFDEVVIPDNNISISFSYPFSKEFIYSFKKISKTPKTRGYTRAELINLIGQIYNDIYNEEELTSREKVIPIDERVALNRNQTDGKYGIWGYDLDDLMLGRVLYDKNEKRVHLEIDS